MKKYEKEVVQAQLNNEKEVLKKLEANYQDALDEINDRIAILLGRDDADMQHVIYQVEYQKALKTQVQSILEKLQTNEFETVSEYLTRSYDEGFLGAMYELQSQGVPLVIPVNQEQVLAAIQHETELSTNLYSALGKDVKDLSKKIASEISRGITNGATYREIAKNVAGYANIPKNSAMRIARTEAHRIQETAASHAQEKAKARGADIVKIWDATLDSKTRTHHIKLDGQIRELDKPFEVAGLKAMRPGQFGRPEEDINCRCRSRADARWALSADETKILGDTSKMSQEQLEALADKLHLSTDELKQYSDQIIPVRASSYDDFKRQYDQLWQYEGSDLQKEAEARISGYAKAKQKQNTSGKLGAGNTDREIKEHKAPEIINHIDYNDENAVISQLEDFEKYAREEVIETACVIAKDGTVYKCYGVADECYIDYDIGDALYGAKVSHNHPINETHFSFGVTDRITFGNYQLELLRGTDRDYTYEFNRNSNHIDEHIEDIFAMNPETDTEHEYNIRYAEQYGIGYRRWKND